MNNANLRTGILNVPMYIKLNLSKRQNSVS